MRSLQQFQIWLSRRWALILFILVIVLFEIVAIWREQPQPRITRTLGTSTQHVDVVWLRQDISPYITASDGVVSAISLTWNTLVAFDIKTGFTNWEIELPFERSGVRGLLADKSAIFTVNATRADAYDAPTGKLKWSTDLGYGHVTVIPQLDSGLLRVYYGDKLFEIDPESGKIFNTTPKDNVAWLSGHVVLKALANDQIAAFDKQTGKSLWTKCNMCNTFEIDEGQEPQNIDKDILIVGYSDKRICALNLLTGESNWCRPEAYISKVAVDHQSQLGYAMRDDFVLATMDLKTGKVLGETKFLSSEPDKEYFGFIPIVFSDGVVVVSFYDSGQTFGLLLK